MTQPTLSNAAPAATDELALGQMVVAIARWVLVLAGLVVTLWQPGPLGQLRVAVGVIFIAAVANFYLHAQLLRRRPALHRVAYAASVGDIALITILVLSQGGFRSGLYVFYLPALAALSLAFSEGEALSLAALAAAVYGLAGAASLSPAWSASDLQVLIARLAMLVGTAVCGVSFARSVRERAAARPLSATPESAAIARARESAEDLFFGQVAAIWARWFVVLTGVLLTLLRATTGTELAVGITPLVVLTALNFFLHGRYLLEKPANQKLLLAVCALDVATVGVVVLAWGGGSGYASPYFVLAYPVLFAAALVFEPRVRRALIAAVPAGYVLLCLATGSVHTGPDLKDLVLRALTLAATGGLGAFYWGSVRRSRRSTAPAVRREGESSSGWQPGPAAA